MTGRECTHWIGAEHRHCRLRDGVRRFLTGLRCPAHTPSALAGRDEPQPGYGQPASTFPLSPLAASAVFDNRAVASGKRRSSPHTYRAAQAAVAKAPPTDLRVDLGQWDAKARRWARFPTADYRCPDCRETESASGDAVAHFAQHIETEHRTRCQANRDGPPAT